jgi:hypothetical protein
MVAFEYLIGMTIACDISMSVDPMRRSMPDTVPLTIDGRGNRESTRASSKTLKVGRIS